jgi:hypothetical protein
MKWYSLGTGIWVTLFSFVGMSFASAFFWFHDGFSAANWLTALGTCASLFGGVIIKRTVDNSKLAKDGVGDYGT